MSEQLEKGKISGKVNSMFHEYLIILKHSQRNELFYKVKMADRRAQVQTKLTLSGHLLIK